MAAQLELIGNRSPRVLVARVGAHHDRVQSPEMGDAIAAIVGASKAILLGRRS